MVLSIYQSEAICQLHFHFAIHSDSIALSENKRELNRTNRCPQCLPFSAASLSLTHTHPCLREYLVLQWQSVSWFTLFLSFSNIFGISPWSLISHVDGIYHMSDDCCPIRNGSKTIYIGRQPFYLCNSLELRYIGKSCSA